MGRGEGGGGGPGAWVGKEGRRQHGKGERAEGNDAHVHSWPVSRVSPHVAFCCFSYIFIHTILTDTVDGRNFASKNNQKTDITTIYNVFYLFRYLFLYVSGRLSSLNPGARRMHARADGLTDGRPHQEFIHFQGSFC